MLQDPPTPDQRPFVYRVLTAAGVVALVAVGFLLLWQATHTLILVFAGFLFALFLRAPSDWLRDHSPLSDKWALAAVLVALVALLGGAGWLLAPSVSDQMNELARRLPEALQRLQEDLQRYAWARRAIEQAREELTSFAPKAASMTLTGLGTLLVIFFIGLFIAIEPGVYRHGLLRLVPARHRDRAGQVASSVAHTLRRWLVGRLFSMSVVGVLTAVGLKILGVPLALLLGLLAALLTFIPYIGPVLSAIPAILLGLMESRQMALAVVLLYAGIQTVESYLLTPLVQREAVSLPPALLLGAQILLGVLLGAVGVVFAVPLTATALVLVQTVYIEDVLGEPVEKVKGA